MTLVVLDASTVVAALIDTDIHGEWAERWLTGPQILAPHLLPAEVTSVLRRAVRAGTLDAATAGVALDQINELRIDYQPFEPFSRRVWQLRDNITADDAWYVAIAESFGAPLVTLDRRLLRSSGPRCSFRTLEPT